MFQTDEKYYNSVYEAPVVRSSISGAIIIDESTEIALSDRDIVPGSLNLNNKCVNGDAFAYGAVFQGELNVTLKKDADRYLLYDKKISFTVHQLHTDGSVQDVPIGMFYITDPQRSRKLITIKAVDAMSNFDVDITDSFFGSIYEVLTTACENCGVELQQTETELKALTNGNVVFSAYNGQLGTYRDLLCHIGKVTCTFATINRFGRLELRPYGCTVTREIPASRRNDTVIADYQTYYRGAMMNFKEGENGTPFEHLEEGLTGLVMDLGDVPVVYGLAETKQKIVDNIYETLSHIRYTPASFKLLISDPTLELGDKIVLKGMTDADNIETYITSFTWKYHDSMTLQGVGGNPKLVALKKKDEVELADLANSVAAKSMIVYTYTNAGRYSITGADEKEIIRISYTTIAESVPIFIATIPVEMSSDGYFILKYRKNSVPVEDAGLVKYLEKGKHFVTCMYHTSSEANSWNELSVVASTEYFPSDNRVRDAEIAALKAFATLGSYPTVVLDENIPSAVIDKFQIKAVLFGQGLASDTKAWDGRLSFIETIKPMKTGLAYKPIIDNIFVTEIVPTRSVLTEMIPRFKVGLSFAGVMESIEVGEVVAKYTVESAKVENYEYNHRFVSVDSDGFTLNHSYSSGVSVIQEIDRGSLCELRFDLSPFASVESVVVHYD